MSEHNRGILLVMLSAILFGSVPLLAKMVYANGGTSITLSFLRNALPLPVLYFMMLRKNGNRKLTWSRFVRFIILAFFFASTPLLLYSSYDYISTGMATTLHFVYPVLVVVGLILFFKAPPSRIKITCVAMCTAGILLFYSPGGQSNLLGVLLAAASGITFACYIVYLDKSGLISMEPYALAFWLSLFTAVEVGLYGFFTRQMDFSLSAAGWIISFVFSIGIIVFATVFFQSGLRIIGPQRAAILSTLEPITSILIGVTVFSELLGYKTIGGIVLILASATILTVYDKEPLLPNREIEDPSDIGIH